MSTITCYPHCTAGTRGTADPFMRRYGIAPPAALHTAAMGLSWQEFVDRFSPVSGPLRLVSWKESGRSVGMSEYVATLAREDRIDTVRANAPGSIGALSSMLYEAGHGTEVLAFHQRQTSDGTATFLFCECDGRRSWSMAIGLDSEDSARRALMAGANILSRVAQIWNLRPPTVAD